MEIGSVREAHFCRLGASLVQEGYPVGVFMRGVCGIWVDGGNPNAVARIRGIKGEQRQYRPLGLTLPAHLFLPLVEVAEIPSGLATTFTDPTDFAARLGSLCFVRVQANREALSHLPEAVVFRADAQFWIQNWEPTGHLPAERWVEALLGCGVSVPAVTSMNFSDQPEIVDQDQGARFCEQNQIPLFLRDPKDQGMVQGSYPILCVSKAGVQLVREGHFDGRLFQNLLSNPVDVSYYRRSKYPVALIKEELAQASNPYVVRNQIIAVLNGLAEIA